MPPARSTRPQDVPAEILAVATRLFAERGFDGTSVQAIADEVGIRKPSLLYHFPSKVELRRSVLASMLDRWNEILPRLLLAAAAGEAQFDAVFRETVDFFVADQDRARLLLRESMDRPTEMRALIDQHARAWTTVVCDYIRKGQKAGRVHLDVDPEAYLAHVINLVISTLAAWRTISSLYPGQDPEADLERHVAELLRFAKSSLFVTRDGEESLVTPQTSRPRAASET